jgi:hypothetical protein
VGVCLSIGGDRGTYESVTDCHIFCVLLSPSGLSANFLPANGTRPHAACFRVRNFSKIWCYGSDIVFATNLSLYFVGLLEALVF